MLAWMLYVAVVTLLLCGAALAAERTARLRRMPTRWIWLLTIIASLLLPTVVSSVSIQVPNVFTPTVSEHLVALREVTSQRLSPASWVRDSTGKAPEWRNLDPFLKQAWTAMSATMLAALALAGFYLFWRKRRWEKMTVGGRSVYITIDVGPAVAGLLQPRIVMPAWVLQSTAAQQEMVMAHEQSHLEAHDPQMLTIALCLLVAMPWNLPLWWQLRRLRYAIEVDCDARVLQRGHNVTTYGETLIEIGQRQSAFIGSVAAMSESKSFLEERINIMLKKPSKWTWLAALALSCLSIGIATVAAEVAPPNAPAEHHQISVEPEVLAKYVGSYELDYKIMRITQNDRQLFSQLGDQPVVEIFPESSNQFFLRIVDAQLSFVSDARGQVTSLILHQNGKDYPAPRIDSVTAKLREHAHETRIRNQQVTPGSEAALTRLIQGMSTGKPDYSAMSAELAEVVQQQMPQLQPMMQHLGAIQSMEFKGVSGQGSDIFVVRHENGIIAWRIAMADNGIIVGAAVDRGP